jgi:DNA polymerase-3 subunit chi
MTQIEFHFDALERWPYTCRLLRKAHRYAQTVGVVGPKVALQQLDAALWTFSEEAFLPHSTDQDSPQVQQASPIRLAQSLENFEALDVLVNLGDDVPAGFEQFARLIEVVANDDHGRMAARQRWRHYLALGYALSSRDVSKIPMR